MSGNDAAETIVGLKGQTFLAPFGTALPTDILDVLDPAFVDVGYMDIPGSSFEDVPEQKSHGAWGASGKVRVWNAQRTAGIDFTLEQLNADNMVAAFGGGQWTTTANGARYDPPTAREINEISILVKIADGTKNYMIIVMRSIVTPPKMQFSDQDITLLPLHFEGMIDADTDRAWYWLDDTTVVGS